MSTLLAVQALAFAWWAAALLLLAGSTAAALAKPAASRRRPEPLSPLVSVLVPMKADSAGLADATTSLLRDLPPGGEIIFSAAEETCPALDSACALARALLPPGQWRAMRTTPIVNANPKVANLVQPFAAARHEVLVVKDAETVLPPGHIAAMARELRPGVGLVVSVPIATAPASPAGEIECAVVNTYGARLLLAASTAGIGIGIGAVMMMRRADVARADALRLMAASIADDHALSKAMRHVGLRTVMTSATVGQAIGPRRVAEVWRRHLRWARCRRAEAPLAFALEPFAGAAAAALAAALFVPAVGLPSLLGVAATAGAWVAAETLLAALKGWHLSRWAPVAILVREAALPVLWTAALASRSAGWATPAPDWPEAERLDGSLPS